MSTKTGIEYEEMFFYENVAMNNQLCGKEGWIDIGSKNYFKEGVAVGFLKANVRAHCQKIEGFSNPWPGNFMSPTSVETDRAAVFK